MSLCWARLLHFCKRAWHQLPKSVHFVLDCMTSPDVPARIAVRCTVTRRQQLCRPGTGCSCLRCQENGSTSLLLLLASTAYTVTVWQCTCTALSSMAAGVQAYCIGQLLAPRIVFGFDGMAGVERTVTSQWQAAETWLWVGSYSSLLGR